MSRIKIKTRTSYFLVTTSGKLRKLNPTLVSIAAILFIAAITFLASQCIIYNQRLINERTQIQEQLTKMNQEQRQLESELNICLASKDKISQLLHFNTDTGKSTDEK